MKYERKKHIYDFQQYETIRSFGDSIYTCKANIVETEEKRSHLLKNIIEFNDKSRSKTKEGKYKKEKLMKVRILFNAFKSRIFPIKATQREGIKLLTSKLMLQRLPIALSQVKAGNTFENLLNETCQIIYSLYRAKHIFFISSKGNY